MRIILALIITICTISTSKAIRYERFDLETGKIEESVIIDDNKIQPAVIPSKLKKRNRATLKAEKLIDSGSPNNRLDIVVVGDGYTAADLDKYDQDVQSLMDTFFNNDSGLDEFWSAYKNNINFWKIVATSNESGGTHLETNPQVKKDTVLSSYYGCAGIDRLICFNSKSLRKVLKKTLPNKKAQDIVLILVNDPVYGGSGGKYAVSSTTQGFTEIVLHEIGHSYGLLADEYEDLSLCRQNSSEPSSANATKETNRNSIKWKSWIDEFTELPTINSSPETVGLFDGGNYCAAGKGFYRPTPDSKMLTLGQPFRAVNNEQLIKRFYQSYVDPIDSFSPRKKKNTVKPGTTLSFSVEPINTPTASQMSIEWYVDGNRITDFSRSTSFTYDPVIYATSSKGKQTVQVIVQDQSEKVRKEGVKSLMTESKTWKIKYKL